VDILDGTGLWSCTAGEEAPPPTEVERIVRKTTHAPCYACTRTPTKMPWLARVVAAIKGLFSGLVVHSRAVKEATS